MHIYSIRGSTKVKEKGSRCLGELHIMHIDIYSKSRPYTLCQGTIGGDNYCM